MASGAVHADLVLFLCGWYREQLASHPAYAGIVFADEAPGPNEPWPPWLVVFRATAADAPASSPLTTTSA